VYIALLALLLLPFEGQMLTESEILRRIVASFVVLTLAFIFICYHKGETPRWQWGKRKD
jgi:hypothetical protein